ncbi:MAG TPA: recombinase RecT [Azospirillum sp.]|nr:recombinase RecT [Azospirillum sp.]
MSNTAESTGRQLAPIDKLRNQLDAMGDQFALALPQHIPVDRFKRIVLTAINQNPDLLNADRKSLMGACMKASQDGLYPDGREGALVIFNTKVKDEQGKDKWIKAVQWMPMVYGIIKKMRNSGELASIVAHAVYEKDHFEYVLGDEEKIDHKPTLATDRGRMVAVYSIAKLKDGTVQREVMPRAEVEKIRLASRAKESGPWKDWYEEMARKSVIRRLAKYLPMSTEIEQMLRRDDALYASADTDAAQGSNVVGLHRPNTAAGQLAAFSAAPMIEHEDIDDEPDPAHVKHPLLSLDGEALSETVSSTQWLERFEHALKKSADPAKLWEINTDTVEWAADQTEDGDRIIFRLRDTYLPKEDARQDAGAQQTPGGPQGQGGAAQEQQGDQPADEWEDELQALIDGGKAKATVSDLVNYKADEAKRIEALPPAVRTRWEKFFIEHKAALGQAKGGKA